MKLRIGLIGSAVMAALFSAASAYTVSGSGGMSPHDPLSRPAEMNSRASEAVLMAITRAGSRMVAAGERGTIIWSDDQGKSWRQAKVPTSVSLTAMTFATPKSGWAVGHGGIVLHSSDAGESWQVQLDGAAAAKIERLAAEAAGGQDEAAKRRLRDAIRMEAEGADKPLLAVHFWNEREGIVVGAYGAVLTTADGGKSWKSQRGALDNPKGKHLYSLFAEGNDLYIAGEQGLAFRSADRGNTFTALKTPYPGTFFGIRAQPGVGLYAYGLRGNLLFSPDKGMSWNKVDLGLPISVTGSAIFQDGSMLVVDESGRVLRNSPNGGDFKPLPVRQPYSFTDVAVSADGTVFFTGVRGVSRETDLSSIK